MNICPATKSIAEWCAKSEPGQCKLQSWMLLWCFSDHLLLLLMRLIAGNNRKSDETFYLAHCSSVCLYTSPLDSLKNGSACEEDSTAQRGVVRARKSLQRPTMILFYFWTHVIAPFLGQWQQQTLQMLLNFNLQKRRRDIKIGTVNIAVALDKVVGVRMKASKK